MLLAQSSFHRRFSNFSPPGYITLFSIFFTDIKVAIDIPEPHAPVVGYDAHEALTHVADLVVFVQELDVSLDGRLGIFVPREKYRLGRWWRRKERQAGAVRVKAEGGNEAKKERDERAGEDDGNVFA